MTTGRIGGFGAQLARVLGDEGPKATLEGSASADLEAAHLGVDVLAARAALRAPLTAALRREAPNGDAVRLPPPSNTGRVPAARARILAVDTTAIAAPREVVVKEAKMRRVLEALEGVHDLIFTRANQQRSD